MSNNRKYDYIIAGMGCAGLSLAVHMILSGKFSDKKVLLVDKEEKNKNDRTWCFWEEQPGLFEAIVYKKWKTLLFRDGQSTREMDIAPYLYKMIRGIDFYNHAKKIIRAAPGFEIQYGAVSAITGQEGSAELSVGNNTYEAEYVFNSIVFDKPLLKKKEHILLQHFKGWVIKTRQSFFDPSKATLMDFAISQEKGTSFVYVMPLDEHRALVEYTLFTPSLLDDSEYDHGLVSYITSNLSIPGYEIEQEEYGIIPMTNHPYTVKNGNIINIGTAGGYTKPSTGYTFSFIQQYSQRVVEALLKGDMNRFKTAGKKHHFYDSVMLNVLSTGKVPGKDLFTAMFKRNNAVTILKFLNNDGNLLNDLSVISSMPFSPFLKAALEEIF